MTLLLDAMYLAAVTLCTLLIPDIGYHVNSGNPGSILPLDVEVSKKGGTA